jgi:hypothetical protein
MHEGIASMEWGGGAKCVESIKGTKDLGTIEILHNLKLDHQIVGGRWMVDGGWKKKGTADGWMDGNMATSI